MESRFSVPISTDRPHQPVATADRWAAIEYRSACPLFWHAEKILRYTRLFTGKDGTSRFEEVEVPLSLEEPAPFVLLGELSAVRLPAKLPVSGRQFVVPLAAAVFLVYPQRQRRRRAETFGAGL